MTTPNVDTIHYVRLPKSMGARAEQVRMTYVLAGKPYADHLSAFSDAAQTVGGKNPFKQFPFVVTAAGENLYQSLAIMHNAAHGTPAWPSTPVELTRALAVWQGAYDLYQAFGGFSADDAVGRKKFEERRAPQYFGALGEIYAGRKFAIGETPTFADCVAYEAIAWCVRRNEVAAGLLAQSEALRAFTVRFTAIPAIKSFMERQAAARAIDDSV